MAQNEERRVRLRDGRTLTIKVPVGMSEAQTQQAVEGILSQAKVRQGSPEDFSAHRQRMVENIPALERGFMGFGQGVKNVGMQLGNIAGIVSDEELQSMKTLNRPLMETTAGTVGGVAGELATLAPVAGGAVGGAAKLASKAVPALRTASAARPIATGIGTGAAEGALEGAVVGGPGRRGEGSAMGAVAGGLTGGVLPLISHGWATATPHARHLMKKGVDLSPAQMNPRSIAGLAEQASENLLPFLPKSGERASRETAQAIIRESAMKKIKDSPDLKSMLKSARSGFDDAYGKVRRMPISDSGQSIGFGIPAGNEALSRLRKYLSMVTESPMSKAGGEARANVKRFLDSRILGAANATKAGALLDMRKDVRDRALDYRKSGKFDEASLLSKADTAITGVLLDYLPPQAQSYLSAVDSKYAQYSVAEDAIMRSKGEFPTTEQWKESLEFGTPGGVFARAAKAQAGPTVEAMDKVLNPAQSAMQGILARAAAASGIGIAGLTQLDPLQITGILGAMAPFVMTKTGRQFSAGATPLQQSMASGMSRWPSLPVVPRGAAAIGYAGQEQKPDPLR